MKTFNGKQKRGLHVIDSTQGEYLPPVNGQVAKESIDSLGLFRPARMRGIDCHNQTPARSKQSNRLFERGEG